MAFFFKKKPVVETSADQEKQHAAKSSVLAALALVSMKVVVGISTGSLGIIAEAAHSALDLVAAVVTFFAVRSSSKPADHEHRYGHGKVENLSALFETVLLLFTCFWIGNEAVKRLITGKVEVEVTVWSFVVMAISIAVDVSRSRMLFRVAKKHRSQALEADALHFSTDIWSSAVVILGLVCVALSNVFPGGNFLHYADAVAALVVAVIVVQISWKLGMRTIDALLDGAPAGLEEQVIKITEQISGVVNCHHVRVRTAGHQVFIDLHVLLDAGMTLKQAHDLTEEIEKAIMAVSPEADVTVHPEPN
ncbi:MAG: cation transporter [Candidatus Omnitrophica bacterium]|nr:cation transporter [Candidatus Omnitrophota bacterium]